MDFDYIKLKIEQKFPTMKCTYCRVEFVLLGVTRHINEYDKETTAYVYQQSKTVYCPYCGKRKED